MTNRIDKLLKTNEQLNKIAAPNSSAESSVSSLKKKHSVDTTEKLQEALDYVVNQDRLMNIGIVGRVKAGKSSLLNALFFEGKNILPSAATPMTAALTTLTYGDSFSATVLFYSTQDIENIRLKAEEYKRRIAEKVIEITEKQSRKAKKETKPVNSLNNEINKSKSDSDGSYKESAHKSNRLSENNNDKVKEIQSRAEREIKKDTVLSAASDQYQRMHQSGLLDNIDDKMTIKALNEDELSTSLIDFVGADGRYMPFTKSVEITLPLESLRDICVIDTPGFNDPVQSREARTVELLKSCDAIFIVSPSGQFLSAQDLEMMGRITKKEGVQEIMVVASQIDMQLFASEKRIGIDSTLDNIVSKLATAMQSTMQRFKEDHPEVGSTFDHLIQNSRSNLYYSSGMSHAIAQKLANNQTLNDAEEHVWTNLLKHYPDYVNDKDRELSTSTLNSIANIEMLKQAIEHVRSKKEGVLRGRVEHFVSAKLDALIEFKREVINETEQAINTIKSSDIETEKQKIEEFKKLEEKVKGGIEYVYSEAVERLITDTRNKVQDTIKREYDNVFKNITDSVNTITESRERDKSGAIPWLSRKLGLGGYEKYEVEVKQVYSAQVIKGLDDFLSNIKIACNRAINENKSTFKKDIFKDVVAELRRILGDDAADPNTTRNVLRKVLDRVPDYNFLTTVKIPDNLQGMGTVKGEEAIEFENQVYSFALLQKNNYEKDTEIFIKDMKAKITPDISHQFTKELNDESNRFREILANKEMSIERLDRFKDSLDKIII